MILEQPIPYRQRVPHEWRKAWLRNPYARFRPIGWSIPAYLNALIAKQWVRYREARA